jgi:hypothetical protein
MLEQLEQLLPSTHHTVALGKRGCMTREQHFAKRCETCLITQADPHYHAQAQGGLQVYCSGVPAFKFPMVPWLHAFPLFISAKVQTTFLPNEFLFQTLL